MLNLFQKLKTLKATGGGGANKTIDKNIKKWFDIP